MLMDRGFTQSIGLCPIPHPAFRAPRIFRYGADPQNRGAGGHDAGPRAAAGRPTPDHFHPTCTPSAAFQVAPQAQFSFMQTSHETIERAGPGTESDRDQLLLSKECLEKEKELEKQLEKEEKIVWSNIKNQELLTPRLARKKKHEKLHPEEV
jgi:hypothetical protein